MYLQCIFVLAVLKSSYCEKVRNSLPIPYPKYISVTAPATITVRWDPIEVNQDNHILGVKVKVWEDEKKNVTRFVKKDGKYQSITELVPLKKTHYFQSLFTVPSHEPAFTTIVPLNVTTASFDVKIGEHYEIRAQTYNAEGDGPLSSATGVRIRPDGEK